MMAVALAAPHFPSDNSGEPRYHEEPRERQNLLATITRFRYLEVLFHMFKFIITGIKKIVRYIEDFVIKRFFILPEVPL